MGGGKTNGIGRYEVPRVYLTRQAFEGDEAKLQKLQADLKEINAKLDQPNPDLNKAYGDLLIATSKAGIQQNNLNDFKAKHPRMAELLYRTLFRISDGFANLLDTQRAMEVLIYFATITNGDVIAYDPKRIQDLQPLARAECAYTSDDSRTWAQERYQELLGGLHNPSNACQGVRACENPVEFHYPLKVKRDNTSGTFTLSGDSNGFERLDLDVFCGIDQRDSLHLIANSEEKFVSGAIAQCAQDATMALRWKASHPRRCSHGIGAAVLPPSIDPGKAMAKRPNLDIPPIPQEIVDLVKPGEEAKKFQLVFLVDASGSMSDDIVALQNLLQEIAAILKEQTSEGGGLQMGLWHVAGGTQSSEQDLGLQERDGESLTKIFSNVFDQILKSLGGGYEPLWKTLVRMMKEENWKLEKDTYRKIVVLSDEWSDAGSNQEPLQVVRMAKEKGIEIKIRGPAAVAYEMAKLVVEGVITEKDYDKVVFLESQGMGGLETRIQESEWFVFLNKLDPGRREKLSALYDDFKFGDLKIPSRGQDKIDLTQAVLDSEDEKIRLQTLRATVERFKQTKDPEHFDLIASYLKDEEAMIRKEAVQFFFDTTLPNSLRLKYASQLAERLTDENGEIRKLAIETLYEMIKIGVSSKEREKYGEAIAKLLKDHKPEIRKEALARLGLMAAEKYVEAIVSALNDPDPAVRKMAVEIIGTTSLETRTKNLGLILAKLKDESEKVRVAVRKLLADFVPKTPHQNIQLKIADAVVSTFEGDESSKEALGVIFKSLPEENQKLFLKMAVKKLEHPDPAIRCSTIEALGYLIPKFPSFAKPLVLTGRVLRLMNDKEVEVRRAAYETFDEVRNEVIKKLGEPWQIGVWLKEADPEWKKLAVLALGVLVPDIQNVTGYNEWYRRNETYDHWRSQYAKILASQMSSSGKFDSFLKKIGLRKTDEDYQKIVLQALKNIIPTLFPQDAYALPEEVRSKIKPFQPKGEPHSVLTPPAGVSSGEKTAVRKGPRPAKSGFNIRDYFEEAPADKPLYVNHRFIHYFSSRPWEKGSRDLYNLSRQPAETEEAWMCVEGETPAGSQSHCYEIGIGETTVSVRPYIESPFTHGIQEEFSKVTAMDDVHFHPKGPPGSKGDEYPSHIDFVSLLQQALVAQGLGYPEKSFAARVVTNTGVFTMKPDFKKINDHFGNAENWVGNYIQIFSKFMLEGPELQGLTQAEKSKRFAQEINAKVSPYVVMEFKPIEPATAEAKP